MNTSFKTSKGNPEPPAFQHETEQQADVIVLHGSIVYQYVNELKANLLQEEYRASCICFDLTGIKFLDSSGFGMLLSIKKAFSDKEIGFVTASPFIKRLFTIAKFDQIFPIFDTRESCIRAICESHPTNED